MENADVNEPIDYERVAERKTRMAQLESELPAKQAAASAIQVTMDDVAKVIELWTGIPAVKTSAKTDFPDPVPPQTKTCSLDLIKLVSLNLITAANVVKAALEVVEDVIQVLFFQIRKLCLELCRE